MNVRIRPFTAPTSTRLYTSIVAIRIADDATVTLRTKDGETIEFDSFEFVDIEIDNDGAVT